MRQPADRIGLAALADWLFYDDYAGLSVVIFAIALAAVWLATNLETVDRRRLLPAGLIMIAGLVPAGENLNALSLAFVLPALGVADGREVTGKGENADINYLFSLGPHALSGINRSSRIGREDFTLIACRDSLIDKFRRETASWRAWGLRNWRLQQHLDEQARRVAG